MSEATLPEIVANGQQIVDDINRSAAAEDPVGQERADMRAGEFLRRHGARLFAIGELAAAAVEGHAYRGYCPDEVNGPTARDVGACPLCRALVAVEHDPSTPEQIVAAFDDAASGATE